MFKFFVFLFAVLAVAFAAPKAQPVPQVLAAYSAPAVVSSYSYPYAAAGYSAPVAYPGYGSLAYTAPLAYY
ncbi:unnamed protein product [Diabrotica balteata]|uniref:Neuropeptide-like 4 n=1 Tax=Diabrotica balteata TaxID=107213 RepID=A0A9N9T952_DIABA|nr:unnamed protein product [Diabrotica balteata]